MTDFRPAAREIESAARDAGLSVPEICRRLDIHRSTWQRYKSGATKPLYNTYLLILALWTELAGATDLPWSA